MDTIDLSAFFQTKAQASDFSARLSLISEKTYNTNFDLGKMLTDQFGIKKKDAFMSLLRENKIDTKKISELKKFLTTLSDTAVSLPVLSLTTAFEPKEKTLQKLSEWFLINVNKQAVFDITVDPQLIGGAAINFNGKHMDFSIRPQFEQILNEVLTPALPKDDVKNMPMHININEFSL
jgi:F0F1-type ATP synthase delta subunit